MNRAAEQQRFPASVHSSRCQSPHHRERGGLRRENKRIRQTIHATFSWYAPWSRDCFPRTRCRKSYNDLIAILLILLILAGRVRLKLIDASVCCVCRDRMSPLGEIPSGIPRELFVSIAHVVAFFPTSSMLSEKEKNKIWIEFVSTCLPFDSRQIFEAC